MTSRERSLKSIVFFVLLIGFFEFLGCSPVKQEDFQNAENETNSINSNSESLSNVDKSTAFAKENFAKDWKSKFESTVAELELNRHKWQENNILNYDFVIAKSAGGTTNGWIRLPVLIKIRDGNKNSIEKVSKDEDYVMYSRTDGFEDFDTIDKLFNYIRQELDNGNIIETEYDKKFGYPKNISIIFTYITNHNSRGIEITKFEVIK